MADLRFGYRTEKGNVRERNEDCLALLPKYGVFAVFDGVGGASSGEIASRTATNSLQDFIEAEAIPSGDKSKIEEYFSRCVSAMNAEIFNTTEEKPATAGMATTAVIAYLEKNGNLYIINIGDSRAYVLLKKPHELRQVTQDHTWVNSMVQKGQLTEAEADIHPKKNMITKALGAFHQIDADFYHIPYASERVLLCTDGLTSGLSDEDIEKIMSEGEDLQQLTDDLVSEALVRGSNDNITVIVFER